MASPTPQSRPRPATRTALAGAAVGALATLLTGCSLTTTIPGTASAAPAPVSWVAPATAPAAPTSAPAWSPRSVSPGPTTAVTPPPTGRDTTWRPVVDAGTGVTADLPGTARSERAPVPVPSEGTSVPSVTYAATGGPAGVVARMTIIETTGYVFDADAAARGTAESSGGTLVSVRPVSAAGLPGTDFVIEDIPDSSGVPGVARIRYVELPDHLVVLESNGHAQDAAVVQQVQERLVASLRIPSA
jgi:hypothetical protein